MKMIFILGFLLYSCLADAQAKTPVDIIRKAVQQINSGNGYTKKVLENEAFLKHATDGGGRLTAFLKNGQIVKLVEQIGLSSCSNTTEYYLDEKENLIFSYTAGREFLY